MTAAWWIAALILTGLALVIQPAREAQPDRSNMDPENPLMPAAAQVVAGISFVSACLLLMVETGVVLPMGVVVLLYVAYRLAPTTRGLVPLYRWQFVIAALGTLAVARLWYSWIS